MLLGENGQGNNEQKPKIGKVTEKSEPDYFGWIHARKRNLKVKACWRKPLSSPPPT
jgi:hypothetical protein